MHALCSWPSPCSFNSLQNKLAHASSAESATWAPTGRATTQLQHPPSHQPCTMPVLGWAGSGVVSPHRWAGPHGRVRLGACPPRDHAVGRVRGGCGRGRGQQGTRVGGGLCGGRQGRGGQETSRAHVGMYQCRHYLQSSSPYGTVPAVHAFAAQCHASWKGHIIMLCQI